MEEDTAQVENNKRQWKTKGRIAAMKIEEKESAPKMGKMWRTQKHVLERNKEQMNIKVIVIAKNYNGNKTT